MSGELTATRPELARWNPWSDVDWNRRLNHLMRSLWPTTDGSPEVLPGASLEETDEAFVFELDLPGVAKSDITIEVSGNRVSVKGNRNEPERDGVVRRSTRVTGSFAYEVTMPSPIEGKDVTAAMTDGVLKITAPKATTARPRHVTIN